MPPHEKTQVIRKRESVRDDFSRQLVHTALYFFVLLSRRRAGEAGEDLAHVPVAIDEDGRWERAEADQLRQRLGDLAFVGGAGEQQREGDAELLAVDGELAQVALVVVNVLVAQADDL